MPTVWTVIVGKGGLGVSCQAEMCQLLAVFKWWGGGGVTKTKVLPKVLEQKKDADAGDKFHQRLEANFISRWQFLQMKNVNSNKLQSVNLAAELGRGGGGGGGGSISEWHIALHTWHSTWMKISSSALPIQLASDLLHPLLMYHWMTITCKFL